MAQPVSDSIEVDGNKPIPGGHIHSPMAPAGVPMPALFTARVRLPKVRAVSATTASWLLRSAVSCLMLEARPPALTISSATCASVDSLMSVTIMAAPRDASSREMVAPRPDPPPVTSATWSMKSSILCLSPSEVRDQLWPYSVPQCAVWPPSMTMTCPATKEAAGDARYSTVPAISSG